MAEERLTEERLCAGTVTFVYIVPTTLYCVPSTLYTKCVQNTLYYSYYSVSLVDGYQFPVPRVVQKEGAFEFSVVILTHRQGVIIFLDNDIYGCRK